MLNEITIMGRLTRNPELRHTQAGNAVTNITVAVDRDIADDNGDRETDFIDCVAWQSKAEFINNYFGKGDMIVVSGRLQLRDWIDKDDNKRRSAEILAENVYFGQPKKNDEPAAQPPTNGKGNGNSKSPANNGKGQQNNYRNGNGNRR